MNFLDKIPADKVQHFGLGGLIGLLVGVVNPILALILVGITAVGKEVYDYLSSKYFKQVHTPEVLDAVATVAGGAVGVGFITLVKYLLA